MGNQQKIMQNKTDQKDVREAGKTSERVRMQISAWSDPRASFGVLIKHLKQKNTCLNKHHQVSTIPQKGMRESNGHCIQKGGSQMHAIAQDQDFNPKRENAEGSP